MGLRLSLHAGLLFAGEDLQFNTYSAMLNVIRDTLCSDHIAVESDDTSIRSYVAQRDLARSLLVIMQEVKGGGAHNVGSGRVIGLIDLVRLICNLVFLQKSVNVLGEEAGTIRRSRQLSDISKV
jgi:dTDP-D-glucose 4,6-dehydratase